MGARDYVGVEDLNVGSAATFSGGSDGGAWEHERPTRPVYMAPARFVDAEPDGPSGPSDGGEFTPRTFEKPSAELTFDRRASSTPSPAPGGSDTLSVSVAFDSTGLSLEVSPPRAPSRHEVTIERRPPVARPRRWIGWGMLVLSIGLCASIASAATPARKEAASHLAAALVSRAATAVSAARALVEAARGRL